MTSTSTFSSLPLTPSLTRRRLSFLSPFYNTAASETRRARGREREAAVQGGTPRRCPQRRHHCCEKGARGSGREQRRRSGLEVEARADPVWEVLYRRAGVIRERERDRKIGGPRLPLCKERKREIELEEKRKKSLGQFFFSFLGSHSLFWCRGVFFSLDL